MGDISRIKQSITITLSEPLKSKRFLGSNIIEILTIRAPTVRDIADLKFTTDSQQPMITLVSRLCGVSELDVMNMNLRDYKNISEKITELIL